MRGRQRGRALVPRGRSHHRDERADRRRQLDGGRVGTGTGAAGHVPDQLRPHAAGLTFGKPELVGEHHQHCHLDERRQSRPEKLAEEAEGVERVQSRVRAISVSAVSSELGGSHKRPKEANVNERTVTKKKNCDLHFKSAVLVSHEYVSKV